MRLLKYIFTNNSLHNTKELMGNIKIKDQKDK